MFSLVVMNQTHTRCLCFQCLEESYSPSRGCTDYVHVRVADALVYVFNRLAYIAWCPSTVKAYYAEEHQSLEFERALLRNGRGGD